MAAAVTFEVVPVPLVPVFSAREDIQEVGICERVEYCFRFLLNFINAIKTPALYLQFHDRGETKVVRARSGEWGRGELVWKSIGATVYCSYTATNFYLLTLEPLTSNILAELPQNMTLKRGIGQLKRILCVLCPLCQKYNNECYGKCYIYYRCRYEWAIMARLVT